MAWTFRRSDLDAYAVGLALLSSGGGGRFPGFIFSNAARSQFPLQVHDIDDLDPDMACVAVGFGGSTILQSERLPDETPYARAIAAIERWTGRRAEALCTAEIGGANGCAALPLATDRMLVDVDLMGRTFPRFDQLSLLADGVEGLAIAAASGDQGVLVHATPRPADAEATIRAAVLAAGGWSGFVVGGFSVAALRDHAITGSVARALQLGRAWKNGRLIGDRVAAVDGVLIATGRIDDHAYDLRDRATHSFAVIRDDGAVARVLARGEFLCVLLDGQVVAESPAIINVVDAHTGEFLQTDRIATGRQVNVMSLVGPHWWLAAEQRRRQVDLDSYGITGLRVAGVSHG